MSSRLRRIVFSVRAAVPLLVVLLAACGSGETTSPGGGAGPEPDPEPTPDPTPPPAPATATLQIRASTTGVRYDRDGYQVTVSSLGTRRLTVNGLLELDGIPPGYYFVEFSGVDRNCLVSPAGGRPVTVDAGEVLHLQYDVKCGLLGYTANRDEGTVTVFETITSSSVGSVAVGRAPTSIAVAPDGNEVYVPVSGEGALAVVDARADVVRRRLPLGTEPFDVVVSPGGDFLYVTDRAEHTLSKVSTVPGGGVESSVAVGDAPAGVALSDDGAVAYVANSAAGSVSVIETATMSVATTIEVGGRPSDVAASPDGALLYVANQDAFLSVVENDGHVVIDSVPLPGESHGVVFAPNGSYAYVTAFDDSNTDPVAVIGIVEAATGEIIGTMSGPILPYGITFGANGSRAYAVGHRSGFSFGRVVAIRTAGHEHAGAGFVGSGAFAVDVQPR